MIFGLLPFFSEQSQFEILDTFIVVLEECRVNCASCSEVGVNQKILWLLSSNKVFLSPNIIQKLIYLIGILGAHSTNAKELKGLLRFMRNSDGTLNEQLAPLILEVC